MGRKQSNEHMRSMAAKSAEVRASRVYLTREEATALVDAYALLRSIARRSKVRNLVTNDPENDNAPFDNLAQTWAHVIGESGRIERQAQIINCVEPGKYLVQWYGWISGGPTSAEIVSVETMTSKRWRFYPTGEAMRAAYDAHVSNGLQTDDS